MKFNSIINSFKYAAVTPLSTDGKISFGTKTNKNAGNFLLIDGKQVSDTKYSWFSNNLLFCPPHETQSRYFYGKRLDSNEFDVFNLSGQIVSRLEQKKFEDDVVVELVSNNQKRYLVLYPELHTISQTFSQISEPLNSRRERLAQFPDSMYAYIRNDGSIINEKFVSQSEPNKNGYYVTRYIDEFDETVCAITNEYHIPTSPQKHMIIIGKQGEFINITKANKITIIDNKGNDISPVFDSYTTLANGTEIFGIDNLSRSVTIFPSGTRKELNNTIIDKKHGIVYGESTYGAYEGHGFIYGLSAKYLCGVSNAPAKLMMSILTNRRLPTSQVSTVINESTDMQETIDTFTEVLKENSALYPENEDIKNAILTAEKELLRKMHRNSSDRERTYSRIIEEQDKVMRELEDKKKQLIQSKMLSGATKKTIKQQRDSITQNDKQSSTDELVTPKP